MANILPFLQIFLSVVLIGGILLQSSSAGVGGAFGGDSVDAGLHTRRGFEKIIFWGTVVVAILFTAVSLLAFVIA